MRQVCNLAYATLADGRDEKALEELDTSIGMIINPEDVARDALREYQESAGMVFEDPDAPVAPMPGTVNEEIRGEPW